MQASPWRFLVTWVPSSILVGFYMLRYFDHVLALELSLELLLKLLLELLLQRLQVGKAAWSDP
jgi:hypothetical protein